VLGPKEFTLNCIKYLRRNYTNIVLFESMEGQECCITPPKRPPSLEYQNQMERSPEIKRTDQYLP
jgi:hypothetical protein